MPGISDNLKESFGHLKIASALVNVLSKISFYYIFVNV